MVEIRFNGVRYGYWQSVRIRESVDDLCASVSLVIASAGKGERLQIDANSLVDVLIDGELVTTVRAGKVRRKVSATDYSNSFNARSLARELVDCQYSQTLSGLSLAEVVKRICSTFKVPVKIDAKTAVVQDFSMQCEVPANALINAARASNLLLYPTPDGGLILTAPDAGEPVATLVYGEHFMDYELLDDFDLRFSEYVVKSFDYDSGNPHKGAVKDAGISFFRPMHIVADKHGQGIGAAQRRAELERNRRLAKAHAISVSVSGWRHAGGVWAINKQVRIVIPDEGVDGVFLIGERELTMDETSDEVTTLTVVHRNAFAGMPPQRKKRSAGARK